METVQMLEDVQNDRALELRNKFVNIQKKKVNLISDLNIKNLAPNLFQEEEQKYKAYYGKIAGIPKKKEKLGAFKCQLLEDFHKGGSLQRPRKDL